MSTAMIFFLASQLLFVLIFSSNAAAAIQRLKDSLQQEITTGNAERSPMEGYLHYVAARAQIIREWQQANKKILFIGGTGFLLLLAYMTSDLHMTDATIYPFLVPYALSIFIGLSVGGTILNIMGVVNVDLVALHTFQINTLEYDTVLALKIRLFLLMELPAILLFEMLSFVIIVMANPYTLLLILLSLPPLGTILRTLFVHRIYTLTRPVRPLEQSEWAYLVPRIKKWAQLAQVEFGSLLIREDLLGTADIYVAGIRRPTLVFSTTLLRTTDWRQQDACIGIAAGLVRRHSIIITFVRNMLVRIIPLASVAFIPLLLQSNEGAKSLSVLPLLAYMAFLIIHFTAQKIRASRSFEINRIAAFLTGDPLAVMVALHTLHALNGTPSIQAVQKQMQQLDELIRQPWERAPQAGIAVPALTPAQFGPYQLTAPLNYATEIGPVPEAAYGPLE